MDVFAAFEKDSGKFVAYSLINKGERCINLSVLKTDPVAEKKGVNAALIYFILLFYENDIKEGCYISNGQRNINHITNFNEYLIKQFCFRRAYCTLNIKYKWFVKVVVKMLFPFRKILQKYDTKIGIIHKVNGVLTMEDVVRKQRRSKP